MAVWESKTCRKLKKKEFVWEPFVTCSICSEDIADCDEALIPPFHIIAHSVHNNCLTHSPNGCPQCRVGHLLFKDRLRSRTKLSVSDWTIL